jgi:hypothetical protein
MWWDFVTLMWMEFVIPFGIAILIAVALAIRENS